MSLATPITLLEQVARRWALVSPLGLVYCERSASAPASIYSCPLPPLAQRLTPAASLTIGPSTTSATNEATAHIGVQVEARGRTQDQVLGMLEDLRERVIKPSGRGFFHTPRLHGGTVQLGGIIGPPPMAVFGLNTTLPVWRIRRLDQVTPPQVLHIASGELATPEGEAAAVMSFVAVATPESLPKPLAAFTVTRTELPSAEPPTPGIVEVRGGILRLEVPGVGTETIDLAHPDTDSVGEVFTTLLSNRWTFGTLNGAVSARQALDLVEGRWSVENGGSVGMGVWG